MNARGLDHAAVPGDVAREQVGELGKEERRPEIAHQVLDEKGAVVAEGDDVASAKRFVVERDPAAASVYTVVLAKPGALAFEDVYLTAVGVPPLFAPTKEDLLVPSK